MASGQFIFYGFGNGDWLHPVHCVLSVYDHFNGNREVTNVNRAYITVCAY